MIRIDEYDSFNTVPTVLAVDEDSTENIAQTIEKLGGRVVNVVDNSSNPQASEILEALQTAHYDCAWIGTSYFPKLRSQLETPPLAVAKRMIAIQAESSDLEEATRLANNKAWRTIDPNIHAEELANLLLTLATTARQQLALARCAQRFDEQREKLSEKDRAVLDGILAGRMNKQMANDLDVSVRTIEQRRRRVYRTFGVDSLAPICIAAAVAECVEAFTKET